ncbi:MAG: glycoside hydrolase family 3 N-terminal domain-containing protein [Pseudomonadota bacterium]
MIGAAALILAPDGLRLTAEERSLFARIRPFGFIVFGRNVDTPDQLRALTGEMRDACGWDAPVFVDQEGGRVQRLGAPHWAQWAPPLEFGVGLSLDDRARAFALRYQLIAAELRAVGLDGNCAPCLDVATPATHRFLRNRCLSDDPAEVAVLGRAILDAQLTGGVLPVIKHAPGHGRSEADSHLDLPIVRAEMEALEADFAPFKALADAPLAMTGHMAFEAIDQGVPATQSEKVIALLRETLGFNGLLMTDDISMNALSGDVVQRAEASLAAGVDVILHCNGDFNEMVALAEAVPRLDDAKAADAVAARRPAPVVDVDATRAELAQLLGEAVNA